MADDAARTLLTLIAGDPVRMSLLRQVRCLSLPDCWVGAGFVRNAVWDHLHGRAPVAPDGDIDIVWFDPARADATFDHAAETALRTAGSHWDWSVKNQARMHRRNGDAPYTSTGDALRHWPETATALALRLADDGIEMLAPFGLDDLFALIVRPTPAFAGAKSAIVRERAAQKLWQQRWPRLRVLV